MEAFEKCVWYASNRRVNILSTIDTEKNHSIPFLDIDITKEHNNEMQTSIFRKPTFFSLGMSYFSQAAVRF